MVEPARIRKCYQLCRAVLRNAAYYRGGASLSTKIRPKTSFAIAASNNFLDMVVLDWCKLFVDKSGKHHFAKILPDPADLTSSLPIALKMDATAFEAATKTVANYRNKEVAHADVYEMIDIPELDFIIESTTRLYEALRCQCGREPTPAAPYDLRATFRLEQDVGASNFTAISGVQQ